MSTATLILRLLTVLISATTFGLAIVAFWYYFKTRHTTRYLPVGDSHVILISISYSGAIVSAIGSIVDDIMKGEPFRWYSSPLLMVSMGAGLYGLSQLIKYERIHTKSHLTKEK